MVLTSKKTSGCTPKFKNYERERVKRYNFELHSILLIALDICKYMVESIHNTSLIMHITKKRKILLKSESLGKGKIPPPSADNVLQGGNY